MKILVTGASGMVGSLLCKNLHKQDYSLKVLTTKDTAQFDFPCEISYWPKDFSTALDTSFLKDVDGVINLAGQNVNQSWSRKNKEKIYNSRIKRTKQLKEALDFKVLDFYIGASATGYYGQARKADESFPRGEGFLSQLCEDWEKAHREVKAHRHVVFRLGGVLGSNGGLLKYLESFLKWKVLGGLGRGDFHLSWIENQELSEIILWSIKNTSVTGIFNACAPNSILFKDFIKILCEQKKAFQIPPLPAFLVPFIFGFEKTKELILADQDILSLKLERAGYKFKRKDLKEALKFVYS